MTPWRGVDGSTFPSGERRRYWNADGTDLAAVAHAKGWRVFSPDGAPKFIRDGAAKDIIDAMVQADTALRVRYGVPTNADRSAP